MGKEDHVKESLGLSLAIDIASNPVEPDPGSALG
jgi:hypothetical protein